MTLKSKRAKVRRLLKLKAQARILYGAVDSIFAKLIPEFSPGDTIEVDGQTLVFVDNFHASNVSYKSAGVKRYELKPLTRAEQQRLAHIQPDETPQAS